MDVASIGGAIGSGLAIGASVGAFVMQVFRSFFRINGQINYWKQKAGEYDIEGRNGTEASSGEVGNPFLEMEGRIHDRFNFLEKRVGCEFSQVFQGHLQCLHDLRAKEALSAKDLIDAIDENILQCGHLIVMLKRYEADLVEDKETT